MCCVAARSSVSSIRGVRCAYRFTARSGLPLPRYRVSVCGDPVSPLVSDPLSSGPFDCAQGRMPLNPPLESNRTSQPPVNQAAGNPVRRATRTLSPRSSSAQRNCAAVAPHPPLAPKLQSQLYYPRLMPARNTARGVLPLFHDAAGGFRQPNCQAGELLQPPAPSAGPC